LAQKSDKKQKNKKNKMEGVEIKKRKITENSIPVYWPVDAFKTQYQTCLLLLAHGIPGLPYEVVYLIVKHYVYVKPLRIGFGCSYVQHVTVNTLELNTCWCVHDVPDLPDLIGCVHLQPRGQATVVKYCRHEQIAAWLQKHNFAVPEHFLL
jgi:hypothetical protein